MEIIITYLRQLVTIIRGEVLVLPSRVAVIIFIAGLLMLPLLTQDPYLLRIIIFAAVFAIFAASWDLLSGFTGQVSFGHALFFGVAAYTAALLNIHAKLPPLLTIPLGALAAVAAGLLVGIPSLRLRGTYLALTTLSFPIILLGIIFALPGFTGGELGISGLARLSKSRLTDYYITITVMLLVTFIMWKISTSKTGIIFHAIREDEIAARAAGINTVWYKLVAFCLSGFFAGIAGGLYVHLMRIAGPSVLEVSLSFQAVIWAVFGGVVTIYGPVAAVFILYPLMEFLRILPEVRILLYAMIILMILLYMPEGLIPWVRDKIEQECPRCKVRNAATRRVCRICATNLH